MWEEQSMGSQTLEILRQGVWASITGGWFYDPSQDVFCNTFHLYLWLFLLCLPFSIYVYFPPTKYMWYFYCSSVTVALATIKLANYFLHHIYDTKECIHEVDAGNSSQKRDEEGIELQDFSTKRKASSRQGLYEVPTSTSKNKGDAPKIQELPNKPNDTSIGLGAAISHLEYSHVDGGISTSDSDSTGSMESQRLDAAEGGGKPSSTIDLKADVHRKNSSESSGERTQTIEVVTHEPPLRDNPIKKSEKKSRHQRSDDYVSVTIKEEKNTLTNFRKLYPESSTESQYPESGILIHHRPSLHSVESEQSASNLLNTGGRRHSNFTNSSLNYLPISIQANMKPTGSLELGYIDKNPNEALVSEGYYFKPRSGVRRIRSTALETCCPPPALQAHPNSLEVIGCKSARNPLPPPSSSLVRNQHLNLCPYYGSEIVYPIAEQSDEHQTSHGPDSDIDSLPRASDSDFEENNQGSHSPLLYIRLKKPSQVPYTDKRHQTKMHKVKDEERTSATSKDALLDMDHSNSSATPEMHDARGDCYATDNDVSDKKLSEGSNLSCSSVEYDERTDHKHKTTKLKPTWDNSEDNTYKITDSDLKICDVDIRDRSADYRVCELDNRGRESEYRTCGDLDDRDRDRAKKFTDSECRVCDLDERSHTSGKHTASGGEVKIVRKKNVRKNKRKRSTDSKAVSSGNCSSLVELDLDWLFDENIRLPHRKEPLKKDTEWSSTTTVSLEHDVSKVLQEPVPSMRSLGAIPKKTARSSSHGNEFERRPPRSESEKCRACRCKPDDKKTKENKLTQTLSHGSLVPEDLDCAVFSPAKMHRGSIPKRGYIKYQQQVRYEEASSSGSNNELSTLLTPSAPLLSALLNTRRELPSSTCPSAESTKIEMSPSCQHRGRLRRARVSRKRSSQLAKRESAIACSLSAGYGTHSAKNFNDTTDGAVHCFMDEHGNWITYTFDEKSVGTVNAQMPSEPPANERGMRRRRNEGTTNRAKSSDKCEVWDSNSADSACSSSVSTIVDGADIRKCVIAAYPRHLRSMLPEDRSRRRTIQVNSQTVNLVDLTLDNIDRNFIIIDRDNSPNRTKPQFKLMRVNPDENTIRTKSYYKFNISPWSTVKLTFDRLKLLALLDRNLTLSETVLSILLGILVAVLGAILLFLDFYKDVLAFIFCFVIASCQYSLLKSVQPDAASPTHGFNRVIAYSRPIYFCLFSALVLVLHYNSVDESLTFYRDFFIAFILFFPLVFSLGLFPQINTFTLYLLEQFDIHIFGGNAMSSLVASFYCIFRSILTVIILNGLAYAGLNEEKSSQHILFSIFCSCLIGTCYHLSRSASDPSHVWNLVKKHLWMPDMYREAEIYKREEKTTETKDETDDTNPKTKDVEKSVTFNPDTKEPDSAKEHVDPLPHKLQKTVNARLTNDAILCSLIAVLVFGIHASTVFTALQPELSPVLWCIAAILGFLLHYIIPQLRKQLPWMCIARPIFRSHEHDQYQIRGPANIMWFERIYIYLCFFERNILYPLLFLSTLTEDSPRIVEKYGLLAGSFITVICGLKCLRCSYSDQNSQYLIVTFTALFFKYDYSFIQETFLVEYFFMSIAFYKFYELLLKVQFVITYIAPWQITWGSAFHAFAQPFSVPHSAMLFLQALISAAFSTPLNPFLGSAIFFTSYVRPVKFWERDYNTRRVDHSNTPLSSHLDRNLGADDNNLNSIFYEHLTRSLQHSLYGDLALGRWGPVSQGDIFVMASDYLNCLVHIIEIGNGLVTFQVRGLEFRGTYCQQREVEAITEGVEENDGCCCCDTGHLPNMLSINAAFSQRWLAWEVTASKYILEGYSISDNSVVSMLQVFEFRKVLVSYYVKSIIFYTVRSAKLEEWLTSQVILKALQPMEHRNFVDLDPVFNYNIDEDYDMQHSGMTVSKFVHVHGVWINYCIEKSERNLDTAKKMSLTLLCFALSLLGRRTLGAVSHNMVSSVEFFLYGLHALFKGDFRITCTRDEWVFTDMDLLKTVVAPGVRMSLKLHQDHFMSPDEYDELPALYDAICKHEEELVISHEGDPAWRTAVLSGTPSLLALRHVFDEGSDEYKIIMLNKRYLSFRIIKINRECVRGLWAGQQQELVYLRNRNPERGSIQNAKQALRNIINSSCDQPIGYPIYVSPLTTSYAETNEQYCSLIGGAVSLTKIRDYVFNLFRRIRKRCGEGCSSGASNREEIGMGHDGVYAMTPISFPTTGSQSIDGSHLGGSIGRGSSLSRASLGGNRGSLVSVGKPTSSTLASLAGLFKERDERAISQAPDAQTRADERFGDVNDVVEKEFVASRVRIVDPNLVYDCINLGRRIDVSWPTEYMRCRGGRSHWKDWVPETGMEGPIVHKWTPGHKDLNKRSHVDRTIVLVQIDDKFVPISENGVQDLGPERPTAYQKRKFMKKFKRREASNSVPPEYMTGVPCSETHNTMQSRI